jgi:hypothetical protein
MRLGRSTAKFRPGALVTIRLADHDSAVVRVCEPRRHIKHPKRRGELYDDWTDYFLARRFDVITRTFREPTAYLCSRIVHVHSQEFRLTVNPVCA